MKWSKLAAGALAIGSLVACATEPSGPSPDPSPLAAKGGGTRLYKLTVTGDFTLPAGSGDVFVTRSSTDPFAGSDITLKNVQFRIGKLDPTSDALSGPSGDPALCAVAYPNAFSGPDAVPADWNGNEGEWSGSASISEKRQIFNVSGSRVGQVVQSSQSFGMSKSSTPDGTSSLTFDNALQYFGGNGATTKYDGRYRCVDFTIVLTPA